jgi:hypothetical protein
MISPYILVCLFFLISLYQSSCSYVTVLTVLSYVAYLSVLSVAYTI